MDEPIKYISKIEIKGLWGRYDLEWNLHPDVNVLSGVNGSGKSTILRYLYEIIQEKYELNSELFAKIEKCELTFNNNETSVSVFAISDTRDFKTLGKYPYQQAISQRLENGMWEIGMRDSSLKFNKAIFLKVDFVKPLDNHLLTKEVVQKADNGVKTYLDWSIYLLQKEYLNYQVDLGKRALNLNGNNSDQKLQKIKYPRKRFIEILNEVYEHTGKYVDETENEISFCLDDEEISPYQLSSGEKQILIILLTTLIQDQKPAILFIDEPEISIHFDVQKKLIDYIRELNPNVQIILATHSPAIIMDGWMDRVKEVSDLIITDNQAVLENAE